MLKYQSAPSTTESVLEASKACERFPICVINIVSIMKCLAMKRMFLKKFERAGFAILLALMGSNAPTLARSESILAEQSTSSDICAPDPSNEIYFTDLQLAHFRKLSAGSASSASFYDLSVDDR